jgi:hypothetical protein
MWQKFTSNSRSVIYTIGLELVVKALCKYIIWIPILPLEKKLDHRRPKRPIPKTLFLPHHLSHGPAPPPPRVRSCGHCLLRHLPTTPPLDHADSHQSASRQLADKTLPAASVPALPPSELGQDRSSPDRATPPWPCSGMSTNVLRRMLFYL